MAADFFNETTGLEPVVCLSPFDTRRIEMKRIFALLATITLTLILNGCNSGGSSAAPPAGVQAVAGDGSVTLTWNAEPGVDYWVFSAAADSVTPENCSSLPSCKTTMSASSPQIISGLVNGTTYSFTIKGRTSGGPGGSGTVSVSAVPRPAGAAWKAGAVVGSGDLRGVTYGATFLATGTLGSMYSSADGITWSGVNSGVAADLNAVAYGTPGYVAVGAGGVIVRSTDAATWSADSSGTTANLLGVMASGNVYIAVGAGGTIRYSTDGVNWNGATSGTGVDLYGVSYGNGRYVAVGAGGVILNSTDAINWTNVGGQTSADIKSVTYGIPNASSLFVAVGASGALITSADGVTWTAQTPIATANTLNGVTYLTQFIALGNSGAVFTSTDGISWTAQNSGATGNLYAITHNLYGYSGVGATGTNLTAF
jgi:hypothetical protein